MSAELRTEQLKQIDADVRVIAAPRLHKLLVEKDELERLPSIQERGEIVDFLVARFE